MAMKVFTFEEVAKHNTTEDCWVVIHGRVFDLTKFLQEHPGGITFVSSSPF
jgi:cytochrome b involved in lipid metabolism